MGNVALTSKQRNKLPKEAFVYSSGPRSNWRYPVPTKAMAAKAGISERQRQSIHASALTFAQSSTTRGSHSTVKAVVDKRRNR